MTEIRESVLAWDLIDEFRRYLTRDELTAAFVGLGVGEYTAVIHAVVHAVARAGDALPPDAAARVQAWTDCYRPTVAVRWQQSTTQAAAEVPS